MGGSIIDCRSLPKDFPTHRHADDFWEELGRTVATFGFLEEVLARAIFAFTATREIVDGQFEHDFQEWLKTLQRALSEPLGGLIDVYGKAVRSNKAATITNLSELLESLRAAAIVRNVLCHGSWREPNEQGGSVPFFVDKNNRIFETPIDIAYLGQVRQHVVELTSAVINTVTHMGWQFPGSSGPGNPIV